MEVSWTKSSKQLPTDNPYLAFIKHYQNWLKINFTIFLAFQFVSRIIGKTEFYSGVSKIEFLDRNYTELLNWQKLPQNGRAMQKSNFECILYLRKSRSLYSTVLGKVPFCSMGNTIPSIQTGFYWPWLFFFLWSRLSDTEARVSPFRPKKYFRNYSWFL